MLDSDRAKERKRDKTVVSFYPIKMISNFSPFP